MIKNLRRRGKDSAATPASSDVAEDIEVSSSQFTSGASNDGQTSTSANPNAYTADTDSFLDMENEIYSAGARDDEFDFFLHDSFSTQTLLSSTLSTGDLTDANSSTSRFASDAYCATLAPVSTMRVQHGSDASMSSAENQSLDGTNYDVTASLALEEFPQADLRVTNTIREEAQPEGFWELQNNSLTDRGAQSAMGGPNGEMEIVQNNPTLSDGADAGGQARRVSLFLEDMRPETANRVTTMLLNSNVDVKMKMTVK